MKKALFTVILGIITLGALAQETLNLQGVILYESAGSPPFYLELGDGSDPIPLSGMGGELFPNIGSVVELMGSFEGDAFVVESVGVSVGQSELSGDWTLQFLLGEEWYTTSSLSLDPDGSFTSFDLDNGRMIEGYWNVSGDQLTFDDSDGLSIFTWSYFEEGLIKLIPEYAESTSGEVYDVSQFPEMFMLPE